MLGAGFSVAGPRLRFPPTRLTLDTEENDP